uniref:Uncharacterized protein n=1 Tax=Fusarium oxysporum (strain Fo5176) TaxID=660025 RepID=A0A0C4DJJ5_FUSOF
MPTNQAVWIKGPKAYPLELGPAPFPTPRPGEVVIRPQGYALVRIPLLSNVPATNGHPNFRTQLNGRFSYIEDLGDGVTHLRKGQRVIGYCIGLGLNNPVFGAFQLYPTLFASLVCLILDNIGFNDAVMLPLTITTAAVSLYYPSYLNLALPSLNPQPSGKVILV